MPTPHIESKKEDINKLILMPGDPKRAKYIADKYLTDVRIVNTVRNMIAYSGKYKNKDITIFPSGMGMPSIGIYSYELFKFYDVDKIIRIGTSGANKEGIHIGDLVLAESSYSLSNIAYLFDGCNDKEIKASSSLNNNIMDTSKELNSNLHVGKIITSDVFDVYVDKEKYYSNYPNDLDTLACEMEAYMLFHIANIFNKDASCILTVVDSRFENKELTSEEREKSLDDMIILALESIIK